MKNCLFQIICFGIAFWSGSSSALKETEMLRVRSLLDKKDFYQLDNFQGVNKVRLVYAKFGKKRGAKGSLVFINGRRENIFLYIELFYDLLQQGWSPIYTYDHRGQGFSKRLVQKSRGHVEDYSYYVKDFEAFLALVSKDPQVHSNNLFALSHSMGSSVIVDHLQNKPQQKALKAVVLDSPLFRIQTGLPPSIESALLQLIRLQCLVNCTSSLPFIGTKKRAYQTSSSKRQEFAVFIEERFPQVHLGGPSYRWILEIYKMTDKIMDQERIQKIKTPILILQEQKDQLVSLQHQDQFCYLIPEYCRIYKLKGQHTTFLETDSIRESAIQTVNKFFLANKK